MTINNKNLKFLNPNINTLKPYVPGQQTNDGSYVKLNTNENPFGPSPLVKKSIIEFLDESESCLRLYPEPESDSLRKAIAKKYSIDIENIFVLKRWHFVSRYDAHIL